MSAEPPPIDGPYRLTRLLGQGGMGAVWEARHEATGQRCALKVVQEFDAEGLARFQREARALAGVNHPHVVRLHAAQLEGSQPYLVQELLEGGSLADALRQGPLEVERARALARQVAQGVAAAHQAGVLHRDLKPDNVLLTAAGAAKVTDFGLAGVSQASRERLTQTGAVLGTPAFMAPEQAVDARAADERADVYGLGALLYAMLTGVPPLETAGRGLVEVLTQLQIAVPPSPRALNPRVPADLAEVCRVALAKDPAERYPTAAAFARALDAGVSASGGSALRWAAAALGCALLAAGGLAWIGWDAGPADYTPLPRVPRAPAPPPAEPAPTLPRPFGFPPSVDRRQAFLGCFAGDALVVSTKTELQWWDGEGRVSQRERFVGGNAGTPEALLACDSGAILRGGDGPLRVWTPAAGAQTYPLLDVRALAGAGELVAYGLGDGTVGVLRLAGGALSPRGEAVALGEGGTRYVARLAWLGPTRLVALLRGLDLGDPESAAVQVVREGRAALALLRHDPATGALELVEEQRRGGAQSLAVLGAAPPTILLGTSLGNLLPLRVTASAEGEALTDVPGQSDRAFGTPVSCRDLAPIDATRALGAFDVRDLDPSGALPKQHAHLNGVLLYDLEQARAQGSAYRARVFVVSGYGPKRLIYDPGSEQVVVFSDVGGAYVYDLATLEEQAERE